MRDRGGEEAEVLDRAEELGLDRGDRLADVAGLELGQLLAVRGDRVGERVQEARALVRGRLAPVAVERGAGRLDGAVDLGLAGELRGAERLAGRRLDEVAGRRALDRLAVDEEPELVRRDRHGGTIRATAPMAQADGAARSARAARLARRRSSDGAPSRSSSAGRSRRSRCALDGSRARPSAATCVRRRRSSPRRAARPAGMKHEVACAPAVTCSHAAPSPYQRHRPRPRATYAADSCSPCECGLRSGRRRRGSGTSWSASRSERDRLRDDARARSRSRSSQRCFAVGRLDHPDVVALHRSKSAAWPWPTPTHIVATP